jgi:hypothetical protein
MRHHWLIKENERENDLILSSRSPFFSQPVFLFTHPRSWCVSLAADAAAAEPVHRQTRPESIQ